MPYRTRIDRYGRPVRYYIDEDPYERNYDPRQAVRMFGPPARDQYGRQRRRGRIERRRPAKRKEGEGVKLDYPLKETGQPLVTRIGTRLHPTIPIPFNAELRSQDGKKFNVRIIALDEQGAVKQIHKLFPGANVHKIGKAKIAEARRIGGRITGTAGKVYHTAERIAKFLDKGDQTEKEEGESVF